MRTVRVEAAGEAQMWAAVPKSEHPQGRNMLWAELLKVLWDVRAASASWLYLRTGVNFIFAAVLSR